MNKIVLKASSIAGGKTELARKISTFTGKTVRSMNIYNWINRGDRVPFEYCLAIETITEGQVTAEKLRPDLIQTFRNFRQHCNAAESATGAH